MKTLLFVSTLLLSFTAQADILCVKNRVKVRNNSLQLANNVKLVTEATCPRGHTLIKDLNTIKDQQLVGFARINFAGTVRNFGGAGVTGINVVESGPGRVDVSFIGKFDLPTTTDSEQNRNLLTATSTAIADNYGVTNVSILSATPTEIVVTVFLWKSDDLVESLQGGLNLMVLKGQAPLL